MKVCLINNLYEPHTKGGAENIVKTLVENLITAKHEVILITTNPNLSLQSLQLSSQKKGLLTIYRFTPINLTSYYHLSRLPWFLRLIWHIFDMVNLHAYFKIKKILKKEHPDLIHFHNLKGLSYLLPRLATKLSVPTVFTPHDVQLINPSGLLYYNQFGKLKNNTILFFLYKEINIWLFKTINLIIAPSQFIINLYIQYGFFRNKKVIKLPNPTLASYPNIEKKKKQQDINFIFIGQLEKHKGILNLLTTFRTLAHQQAVLHIFGKGSLEKNIIQESKINNNIFFHGYLDHQKINDAFNIADFLIFPSLVSENSPGVIYESLNAQVPVIAANVGGVSELITSEYNGWLCSPNEIKMTLQKAIKLFKQSPNKYQIMRKNCVTTIKKYSIENYLIKIIDHYKKLI